VKRKDRSLRCDKQASQLGKTGDDVMRQTVGQSNACRLEADPLRVWARGQSIHRRASADHHRGARRILCRAPISGAHHGV